MGCGLLRYGHRLPGRRTTTDGAGDRKDDIVKLTEFAVSLVVTTGAAAAMSVALDLPALASGTTATAQRVGCRAVETALAAYLAEHDAPPARTADLRPYLAGDVSGYRIVPGPPAAVAGPGCDAPA